MKDGCGVHGVVLARGTRWTEERGSGGRMVVVKGFLDLGVSKGVDLATVVITSTKSLNED